MDPLVVKFVEVAIMQVLVFGAVAAILVAAVWDVVQAKVREARRRDQIAQNSASHNRPARQHIHNPFAHHNLRP
jgi:Na+-translocating ferredoxin:NAD+ oxidoreductase RnfG subunit